MTIHAYAQIARTRRPTIDCPICGREIGVEPHMPGRKITHKQRWFILKMRSTGLSRKVIAKLLRTSISAVGSVIFTEDRRDG